MTGRGLSHDLIQDLAAIAADVHGIPRRPKNSSDDRRRQLVVACVALVSAAGNGEAAEQGAGMTDHTAVFGASTSRLSTLRLETERYRATVAAPMLDHENESRSGD